MSVLRCKFRGALLGALFGDALGALFEGDYWEKNVPPEIFDEYKEDKLLARKSSGNLLRYTDDTAMTKCLCRSLLSKQAFNVDDLANEFVQEYYREPNRGYGSGVVTVFHKLYEGEHEGDVTRPAREQFDGTGSYGNGAAMRISPLGLFYHNDLESLVKDSKTSALITHSHVDGVNGAVLQAIAVYEALNTIQGTLDATQFIDKLINTAKTLENEEDKSGTPPDHSYVTQLEHIKTLLSNEPTVEEVVKTLGHGIKAIEAVPAAIFSFLHKSKSNLKEVIFYAISLGGDTDTIASMAAAIGGAYWGDKCLPQEWYGATESVDETIKFADEIYNMRVKE